VPSVFTRIINGELPGRFVWKDPDVVAFLSINPIEDGHTLIVPRQEVDHWLDLDPPLWKQCAVVAQHIGRGIQHAFEPPRVAQIIAGFEVPHAHVHVLPAFSEERLSFAHAQRDPDPDDLDAAAERLRRGLLALGFDNEVAAATA
jgi:diadenosine tetraphosphate (Ap4A) HIT family hydrolase